MREQDAAGQNGEQELLKLLVSQDWRVRKEAVEALTRLDRVNLARGALEIIRQDHANLSALNAALQLLERVGQPLMDEIIALLNDKDEDLRIYVPLLLAELGGPTAVQALSQVAADRQQPENVRFNAIEALGKLQAAETAPMLVDLLRDENNFLRYGLVVALGQIGLEETVPVLLPLLEDAYLHEAAVHALGSSGDVQAAGAIGRWMLDHPTGAPLAVMAAAAIERRLALKSVENGNAARKAFLDAVGLDGARGLGYLLVKEDREYPLEDPFWKDLALVLGWAVRQWPAEMAFRSVLAKLLAYPAARPIAETALHQTHPPAPCAAVQELLQALSSDNLEECYAAARLLRTCADPESLPVLAEALQSADEMLAALTVEAIGAVRGQPAADLLFPMIGDERDSVRQAVIDALAKTNVPGLEERAEQMLRQAGPVQRASALRLLASLDAAGAALAVVAAAEDPAAEVRRTAYALLPGTGSPQAARIFRQALADPDENLRRTAVQAIAELPAEDALALLESAARDNHQWVRVQAVHGLGRFPGQQSLDALAACLRDPFPPVRSAVVQALVQRLSVKTLPPDERERVVDLLVEAQVDEEELVRLAARAALKEEP